MYLLKQTLFQSLEVESGMGYSRKKEQTGGAEGILF